jgi:hypothetical protein
VCFFQRRFCQVIARYALDKRNSGAGPQTIKSEKAKFITKRNKSKARVGIARIIKADSIDESAFSFCAGQGKASYNLPEKI